jgi:hypothetical protein
MTVRWEGPSNTLDRRGRPVSVPWSLLKGGKVLVVRVFLWPGGDESAEEEIALGTIINDGTGLMVSGNYKVSFAEGTALDARADASIVEGRVKGFSRLKEGPWQLLAEALNAAGISPKLRKSRPLSGDGGWGWTSPEER